MIILATSVRNITQNGSSSDAVSAAPSDVVEFSLRVSSTGPTPLPDVLVRDALPAGMRYLPGSTFRGTLPIPDGIVSDGVHLGVFAPQSVALITFRAIAEEKQFFAPGTTTLSSIGSAYTSGAKQIVGLTQVSVARTLTFQEALVAPSASTTLIILVVAIAALIYSGYASARSSHGIS